SRRLVAEYEENSCEPRTLTGHALRSNAHDETRRRIGHWRKSCARPDVHLSQLLQQLGRATLGDSSSTMHHQIVMHPNSVRGWRFERDDDAGVASHIPKLLLRAAQMRCDELVTVDADPNDGYLWAPISIHGHQMTHRTAVYHSAGALGQSYGHVRTPALTV